VLNYVHKHNELEIIKDIAVEPHIGKMIVEILGIIYHVYHRDSTFGVDVFKGCPDFHVSSIVDTIKSMTYENRSLFSAMVIMHNQCDSIINSYNSSKNGCGELFGMDEIRNNAVTQKYFIRSKIISYFQQEYDRERSKKNA
jgi:hypothetical protein